VILIGSEMGGVGEMLFMRRLLLTGKKSRAGAAGVTKVMSTTSCGNLATMLGTHGRAYSVASSAATGIDNIGQGYELLQRGVADVAICGATEEDCWKQVVPSLERWYGVSTHYNDRPAQACRPFDANREGMVLAEGAGILLLETLEHAQAREARIYAEIAGYAAAQDGADPLQPSGDGLRRAAKAAWQHAQEHGVERLDYVNSGAAGIVGQDPVEAAALRDAVGDGPLVSSTVGQMGHALGATSALQTVMTLLMMSQGFIAPTANLESVAPECAGLRHVTAIQEAKIGAAMCVASGVGGFNSSLVLNRL
jgi:3-oxoacyl-[acyl-carrier-protein] synthase-1